MLKYIFSIAVGLFILMACNNTSNSNAITNTKTDTLVALPFLMSPTGHRSGLVKRILGMQKFIAFLLFLLKTKRVRNLRNRMWKVKFMWLIFFIPSAEAYVLK